MARKRKSDGLPFTPAVFRWARARAGLDIDEAAGRLKIPVTNLTDWEDEDGQFAPTVKQARDLAELYGRSFLELFLPEPPDLPTPELIPDFRLYRNAENPTGTRELLEAQTWAETQRDNALDLYSEIGDEVPKISAEAFGTIESDAERLANLTRQLMQFPVVQQIGLQTNTERAEIPSLIRSKIETLGILTLRRSDLKRFGVRGFCVAKFPLPVIVFTSESPNAQSFTLAHELAHILIKQSAISSSIPKKGGDPRVRRIEEWCNTFAAAFLMPRQAVLARLRIPNEAQPSIPDDDLLEIARYFGVSSHAMLVRLVELKYVQESYYWDYKKAEFEKEEREFKSYGRPKFYGRRYSNSLGGLYTSLVMEAWSAGRLTNHNAAEFMGIKNLAHLHDIRREYGT